MYAWPQHPLDARARSDVHDLTQQSETDAPAVAIAGVDRGGALVDARDDAHLRV